MFWKRTMAILLSIILIVSSIITYPMQAAAAKNSYLEEFYSNPNNLLSLLPPFDSHQPMTNQTQNVTPPLPNTSSEIPNNDVSPRKEAELPPPGNMIPEIPVNVETGI